MDALITSMPPGGGKPSAMTSLEIAELVDKRHDNVKRTIESLAANGNIQLPQTEEVKNHLGQAVEVYLVPERDSFVVVARLSPEFTAALVDYWQANKQSALRMPTTAEAFAHAFTMLAENERRMQETDMRLIALDAKVDQIADTQLYKAKTQDMETITEIRKRMNKRHGLPERIVNDVVRQMPYSPRPCGMVRNTHEGAEGSSFAVYWIKDISKCFARFVGECKMVSAMKATHPDIEGKFQLVKGGAA